jgi:hypothetical protein
MHHEAKRRVGSSRARSTNLIRPRPHDLDSIVRVTHHEPTSLAIHSPPLDSTFHHTALTDFRFVGRESSIPPSFPQSRSSCAPPSFNPRTCSACCRWQTSSQTLHRAAGIACDENSQPRGGQNIKKHLPRIPSPASVGITHDRTKDISSIILYSSFFIFMTCPRV